MLRGKDLRSILAKRATMTFFSDPKSQYSHRVRIVLAEKGVTVDVVETDASSVPDELAELNPYRSLPTLVDRDLVLYESKVMMEYLDERFPHPPLLPVYPVARADSRQFMCRMEKDWCHQVDLIENPRNSTKTVDAARKTLRDELIGIAPIFAEKPFFMSDEFSLVDCCLAPILWRLPILKVQLSKSKQTKPLLDYMERVFARDGFRASLSETEREMRKR
jgi:RNA polymerase-associated protein